MKILVADTETTGLIDPIEIVELAYVEVDEELLIVDEFLTLVKANKPIECGAAGKHGIRDKDLIEEKPIEEIVFPDDEIILICHNIPYDLPLLEPHMTIVGEMCTLVLARRFFPDAPDHQLGTLSCYLDLPRQLSHRALGDVKTTHSLLAWIMDNEKMSLQEIYDYYNEPVLFSHMPWGKHKGMPMEKVPGGYINWLSNLEDLDKDMRATVDNELRRRTKRR